MTALAVLRKDHAAVKRLFAQWSRTTTRAHKTRTQLLEAIARELDVHARLEAEIFYPAVAELDDARRLVDNARAEHEYVASLVAGVRAMDPRSRELPARVRELREVVMDHAEDEESEMFPLAERLGDERLAGLGRRLEARKQELVPAETRRKRDQVA